jgi:hypothetical protein
MPNKFLSLVPIWDGPATKDACDPHLEMRSCNKSSSFFSPALPDLNEEHDLLITPSMPLGFLLERSDN